MLYRRCKYITLIEILQTPYHKTRYLAFMSPQISSSVLAVNPSANPCLLQFNCRLCLRGGGQWQGHMASKTATIS